MPNVMQRILLIRAQIFPSLNGGTTFQNIIAGRLRYNVSCRSIVWSNYILQELCPRRALRNGMRPHILANHVN